MDESTRTQELQQSFREEVAHLQKTLTGMVSVWLTIAAYGAVFLFPLYGHRAPDEPFWALVALTTVGVAAYLLHLKAVPMAHALLAVGPMVCLARVLSLSAWAPAPYVTPLLVLASFVLGVWPGLTSLLVGTAVVLTAPLPGAEKLAVLLLIWLTASMAWLGTRGFRMALSWSHNSQMRALQLLSELRARRGETAPMPPLIVEIALRDIWKTYAVIGVSLVVLIVGTARLLKSLRMFEAVKLGSQLTG
jgi:hypothetical protein